MLEGHEYSHAQNPELRNGFTSTVRAMSGEWKKGKTNWDIVDLPNTSVGFLHSKDSPEAFIAYIQPKLFLREGPYLKFSSRMAHNLELGDVTFSLNPNKTPLKEVLMAAEAIEVANSGLRLVEEDRVSQVASNYEMGLLVDALGMVRRASNSKRLGKAISNKRAESRIDRLITYLRDTGKI